MKIKSQRDFFSGLMFVLLGLTFAWASTEYSFGSSARPGPGYFPFGLGVLLALLGALVLFKALTIESEGGDPIGAIAWRPLLVITAAIVLFGLCLPRLGLAMTLPMVVTLAAAAGDEFRWRDALLNSVVLTLGSWVIFVWGLKLVIPVWPVIFGN
ncbi:tripartite tricarboxylate transporter TctB family protein [Paucibacter sp. DJ2R-2]|uniref:tripartite tricarboxylate transporter TctB family protein n=1 Tax=Paucibacter sp. DJ2R-2 TaxID=2893558 RepID=UPI0021E445E3|nr:tripartite tricarboxylate transporter TctB family protein [Paucibacter sp. DJ2R-2]MCV2421397.1 tripartite tricarboxylate transporter TctB family protein [Paucibacter sp. DJ4R-1]MCV2438079.1 tripartite tricarboxylate transporter TctB family protein [Paucibacter sp. DJ2R-2]